VLLSVERSWRRLKSGFVNEESRDSGRGWRSWSCVS
jgi:hypothetical protein